MIDLHTHTLLSDGELLPSELVRRAEAKGYTAIALTDHVDSSNIDFVLPRLVSVSKKLNKSWKIRTIPGVEITHVPLEDIKRLVKFARKNGAKVVIVHGETTSEPVIPGTNRYAIEAGCDILAHPGLIKKEDVMMAKEKGVYLELTTRKNHLLTNGHIANLAIPLSAKLVLNNDAHGGNDLVSQKEARVLLEELGLNASDIDKIFKNSLDLVKKTRT